MCVEEVPPSMVEHSGEMLDKEKRLILARYLFQHLHACAKSPKNPLTKAERNERPGEVKFSSPTAIESVPTE